MENLTSRLSHISNKFLFRILEGIETSCLNDKKFIKIVKLNYKNPIRFTIIDIFKQNHTLKTWLKNI